MSRSCMVLILAASSTLAACSAQPPYETRQIHSPALAPAAETAPALGVDAAISTRSSISLL